MFPPFARGLYTGATGLTPVVGGRFSRSYLFSSLEKSQRRNNLEGGTGWILKEERLHCRVGGGT